MPSFGHCSSSSVHNPGDAMIAVMGPTGTGKSSFIRLVTGNEGIVVGHGLESETSEINYAEYFTSDGRKVTLVDTPGFDDSREDMSDVDILCMISEYLTREFYNGKRLYGVIYTHNIANTRMGGVSRRNLKMFRRLNGPDSLKNVLIVTTMWGSVDKTVGERREDELKSEDTLFKPLIDAGAQLVRHDLGSESARRIIETLLGNTPKELLIQTELSNGISLARTSAGAELSADLDHIVERDSRKLRDLQQELDGAFEEGDMELVAELKRELAKLRRRIHSREEDKEKLATTYYRATTAQGTKRAGNVVGVVGGMAGIGLLTLRRLIEMCVGVPKTEISTQVSSLVENTGPQRCECAARGKYFKRLTRSLTWVAIGATVALTVNANARTWIFDVLQKSLMP